MKGISSRISLVAREIRNADQLARSMWAGTFKLETSGDLIQARHFLGIVIASIMQRFRSTGSCIRAAYEVIDDEDFQRFLISDEEAYEACVSLSRGVQAAAKAWDTSELVGFFGSCLVFPVGSPESLTDTEADAIAKTGRRICGESSGRLQRALLDSAPFISEEMFRLGNDLFKYVRAIADADVADAIERLGVFGIEVSTQSQPYIEYLAARLFVIYIQAGAVNREFAEPLIDAILDTADRDDTCPSGLEALMDLRFLYYRQATSSFGGWEAPPAPLDVDRAVFLDHADEVAFELTRRFLRSFTGWSPPPDVTFDANGVLDRPHAAEIAAITLLTGHLLADVDGLRDLIGRHLSHSG